MKLSDSRHAALFRHVSAEKAALYRAVMEAFAGAQRSYRLDLRPDEVRAEAPWPDDRPSADDVQQLLGQLVEWGNLQAQPDTGRVLSLEDFYRRRFLYRLSYEGEAVEAGLAAFAEALARRGELQSVALEDIAARLQALSALLDAKGPERTLDAAKVHEVMRDLAGRLREMAESAQSFMADMARASDLQQGDLAAVMRYKSRLVDYLERFIGDLVAQSHRIATLLLALDEQAARLIRACAQREARDAAPGDNIAAAEQLAAREAVWAERWQGLLRWFVAGRDGASQAEHLRAAARAAIISLLGAVATLNERRAGKSDRARDFRALAQWFAECADDADAHRLYRAAFALNPCRHLALTGADDVSAATSWLDAPVITIHPRLRERGRIETRGTPPRMLDRSRERQALAQQIAREQALMDTARKRLAQGRPMLLSQLGPLSAQELKLLLSWLAELLAAQGAPGRVVARPSNDGTLELRLEPLPQEREACIDSELGVLRGREHRLTVTPVAAP